MKLKAKSKNIEKRGTYQMRSGDIPASGGIWSPPTRPIGPPEEIGVIMDRIRKQSHEQSYNKRKWQEESAKRREGLPKELRGPNKK